MVVSGGKPGNNPNEQFAYHLAGGGDGITDD